MLRCFCPCRLHFDMQDFAVGAERVLNTSVVEGDSAGYDVRSFTRGTYDGIDWAGIGKVKRDVLPQLLTADTETLQAVAHVLASREGGGERPPARPRRERCERPPPPARSESWLWS